MLCLVLDRPGLRGVIQAEKGAEQFAFLQLLHPHQLKNQESRHQPQDVCMSPHTYITHTHTHKHMQVFNSSRS